MELPRVPLNEACVIGWAKIGVRVCAACFETGARCWRANPLELRLPIPFIAVAEAAAAAAAAGAAAMAETPPCLAPGAAPESAISDCRMLSSSKLVPAARLAAAAADDEDGEGDDNNEGGDEDRTCEYGDCDADDEWADGTAVGCCELRLELEL